MENAPAGEEGTVLTPASVLQGRQGQAFLCCNTVSRETRSGSSSSSGGGSSSKSSGTSRSKSGSMEESSSSEDTQEYDRHLAQAQRQDLSRIAATRALYVAGEDRRGRTCVVFSPELVRDHQSPAAPAPKNKSLKKRGNSFETQQKLELPRQPQHLRRPPDASTAGGSAGAEDGWSSARNTSPRTQAGSRLDTGAVGGSSQSSISRRGRTAAASPRNRHTAVGGQMAETPAGTTSAAVGVPVAAAGGPLSALESSVGSAAMEELLLYFVRMMDPIADGEYVLLLCGGCPGVVGDDSGKIGGRATAFLPGGERSGWLTWGRFSMLGQMHSLLPRRFKKNLAGLVVLQPTPVLHAFFDFANLFLSPKFYRKLEFCDGVEELTIRFPRRIIENLPEGVLSAAGQGRSGRQAAAAATVPSPAASRWHSSPGVEDGLGSSNRGRSLASPRALDLPPTEKDDRPSPLRVARVVAGGMQGREQVQGDDNWTPPPLPPPPLQSASKPASPLLGGGSARSGSKGKGRFHRATLEKRFSTSSATLTLTPKSTPSPEASASAPSVGYGGTPGTAMNSSSSSINTTTTTNTKGSSGNSSANSGTTKPGLFSSSVAFAEASTPMATATVTTTPTRKHYSSASFGGGAYASVSAASSAATHGISPSSSAGGFSSMRSQQPQQPQLRHSGGAQAQPSHRRGASTGGCWDRGRAPHSFSGGGRTGGVSPTTPKGTGHSRRSAFANGTGTNSSPSPWSPPTAANVSGDRQSSRPSPSPSPRGSRGVVVVTPRGTSAQRGSWGGSPCSGGGFRSSPTTPRHAGTPNQVSFASSSGLPARKGSRGGGSPAGGGQRQPQPKQQKQEKQKKQLHRLCSWPVVGDVVGDDIGGGGGSGWSSGVVGGNAGAASPRAIALSAGSGWGGSGFHTASGVIEVSQWGEMRGAAPQKSKSSPRQLPQKSPRAKRPVDSGRISVSSERPENVGAPALSGGPGKAKDGRKRHSFTFANSRGNARRSSSGQITSQQQQQQQQMTRPESPLRPRPRSSSNILSPTEIAALEREVKCRSARVTSSAARSAGFVRYSVASRVNGSGGGSGGGSGSGFAVSDRGLTLSPPSASRTAVAGDASGGDGGQDGDRAGEHGRGAGAGAAVGKARDARDRGERKPMATVSRNTSGGNGGSGSRSRDAGGGAAMRGGGGAEVTSYCPAPADHPAPLRRASEGAQMIKSAAAVTRSTRGRGGGGGRAGVIGRSSVSGCGGGATVKQLSTSARISPGIQALMANYGAATRASPGAAGTPTPAFPPKAATTAAAAAAAAATAVGDGVCDGSGRKATTAATPRSAPSSSPLPPPAATATSLPLRAAGRESSPPASRAGVFASAPGGGPVDASSGDGVPTSSRTAASNTTASNSTSVSPFGVAEAGRGSARGSGAVASGSAGESLRSQPQQQQQHRGQHRYDAGGMRRALRKHRESLQSALKAEGAAAAVAAAVAEAKAAEEGDADNGGMNEAGNVETRSEAVQRRRKLPDPTNKVFGVPLVEILQRTPGEDIPWVLRRFVGFLSKFGLESVGLFRLAGDGMDRAVLRDALDHGKQVCWDPADDREGGKAAGVRLTDVNMVAQLLKAFVRELPEPLIPFSVYGKVVAVAKATGGADAQWVQAMRSILWSIPNANYNCLRFLFEFLREVASHSSTNRMTSENLAIVWAPNLLRPQDDDPFAILRDLRFQIETVRWMVDCCDQLFDD